MAIRVDVARGGSNCLHHQRTVPFHDVDAVTPHVCLTDKRGGEVEAVLLGEEEGVFVVGVDVVGEKWRRLEEGDVRGWKEAEEMLDNGLLLLFCFVGSLLSA